MKSLDSGTALFESGEYAPALAAARTAIQELPSEHKPRFLAGLCLFAFGDFGQAAYHFRTAFGACEAGAGRADSALMFMLSAMQARMASWKDDFGKMASSMTAEEHGIAPEIDLFSGKTAVVHYMKSLDESGAWANPARAARAGFYLGFYFLSAGDRSQAEACFRKSAESGAGNRPEAHFSKAALTRIEGK